MKGRAKPTAQHKKDGTYQASRHARRVDSEAAGGPLGEPPTDLDETGQHLWRQVVDLLPEDVVQKIDGATLRAMCEWWSQLRTIWDEMRDYRPTDEQYYRLNQMAAIASKHFNAAASRFGMTPSDRAKIKIADTERKESNPFKVLDALTG